MRKSPSLLLFCLLIGVSVFASEITYQPMQKEKDYGCQLEETAKKIMALHGEIICVADGAVTAEGEGGNDQLDDGVDQDELLLALDSYYKVLLAQKRHKTATDIQAFALGCTALGAGIGVLGTFIFGAIGGILQAVQIVCDRSYCPDDLGSYKWHEYNQGNQLACFENGRDYNCAVYDHDHYGVDSPVGMTYRNNCVTDLPSYLIGDSIPWTQPNHRWDENCSLEVGFGSFSVAILSWAPLVLAGGGLLAATCGAEVCKRMLWSCERKLTEKEEVLKRANTQLNGINSKVASAVGKACKYKPTYYMRNCFQPGKP